MDKIVDALTTTYRSLLVLCAVLLLLLIASGEDQYPHAHQLAELEKLQADHYRLIENVEKESHAEYLEQFLQAAKGKYTKNFLQASRFGSSVLVLVSSKSFPVYLQIPETMKRLLPPVDEHREEIPLNGTITANQLLELFDLNLHETTTNIPIYHLNQDELQHTLPALLSMKSEDATAAFFRIFPPEAAPPQPAQQPAPKAEPPKCFVTLAPFATAKQPLLDTGYYVACDLQSFKPLPSFEKAGVTSDILYYPIFSSGDDRSRVAGYAIAIDAIRELRLVSAQEYAKTSDETDILGFKLRKSYLLRGGPVLISLLLIQMLAYFGTAKQILKRARRKEAGTPTVEDAAHPWYQQFSGMQSVFMFFTIVVFPFFICFALTGSYLAEHPLTLTQTILTWGYSTVLPGLLALFFFILNAIAASQPPEITQAVWRGVPVRQRNGRIDFRGVRTRQDAAPVETPHRSSAQTSAGSTVA